MKDLQKQIESYVKQAGGRRKASAASQAQLPLISDTFTGRFDLGKLYFFNYFTPDEPWYDTQPIILGLGPSEHGNQVGLNLHYIPYEIRLPLLSRIWAAYYDTIKRQLLKHTLGRAARQQPLPGFTWDALKAAYGEYINLGHCVRAYRIDRIQQPRVLGYESWHIAAVNDENRFHGTTIAQAQALYYSRDI